MVFCGNSVYLCGLAAGLRQYGDFRINLVAALPKQALPELKMLCPDVVILEVSSNTTELSNYLCEKDFHPVLVIVYPQTDSLAIFAGGRRLAAPVDDLAQVIVDCTRDIEQCVTKQI